MEQVKAFNNTGFAGAGALPRTGHSAAPDLSRYRRRPLLRENRTNTLETVEQPVVAVPRARVDRSARRVKLSVSSALVFLAAFSAVMFIVYTYMQLAEMSAETSKLQKTLTTIKKENTRLQSQMDKQLDLALLEEAAQELGMVLPEKENIVYLDLSGTDHAVVLEKPGFWDSLMDALGTMTAKVHEYFS